MPDEVNQVKTVPKTGPIWPWIVLGVLVLLILGGGGVVYYWKYRPMSTPPPQVHPPAQPKAIPTSAPMWQTFTNADVQFNYADSYSLQPNGDSNLTMSSWGDKGGYGAAKSVQAKVGHFYLTAMFTVSQSTDAANCFATSDQFVFSQVSTIRAVDFKKSAIVTGNAAGNQYTQQAYRVIHDGKCWDITLTNHASTDGVGINASEDKQLTDSSWTELTEMLQSFKFVN